MRRSRALGLVALGLVMLAVSACGADESSASPPEGSALPDEDMGLGDVGASDMKADGNWGQATTCKAIPELPRLKKPKITVSIQGLTVHLVDTDGDYDEVFPIGPGAINTTVGETTYGESRSMFPLLSQGRQDFEITPATSTACKIWWKDSATGETLPVFAGLPFLSWSGAYALHGPVDNYRAANGGNLRRGFVSHGCIRMQAADILELYGRIRGLAKVPVHVQREPERLADGSRVDVADAWLGAECGSDADCPYPGGKCEVNALSERGFCTRACTGLCSDKTGYPTSFCVADPAAPSAGICVLKESSVDQACRQLDHFVPGTQKRFGQSVTANVCMPGSPGWIGDHCLGASDCATGNQCVGASTGSPGLCTRPCGGACPDQPGFPTTTCIDDPALAGKACARTCTSASNASECPGGTSCVQRKHAISGQTRWVCLPS